MPQRYVKAGIFIWHEGVAVDCSSSAAILKSRYRERKYGICYITSISLIKQKYREIDNFKREKSCSSFKCRGGYVFNSEKRVLFLSPICNLEDLTMENLGNGRGLW